MLNARDVAMMDVDEVWSLPEGTHTLRFDDGTLKTNTRATIFSWYIWEFIRQYPKTPILKDHHVGDAVLKSNTHLDLIGRVFWDAYEAYAATGDHLEVEQLSRLAYQVTNKIYNDMTYRLEQYVTTISVLDFVDVLEHPEVKKANEEVVGTQYSIDKTYKKIRSVLTNENEFPDNVVGVCARSGLVSMGQILQCVGPRGFLTDIDSNIFRKPILTGYVQGINKLHDSMIESRSASKSLMYTKDPLSQSEYFNRKLQLTCSVFKRIHLGDCGSQKYLDFHVRSTDLKALAGKLYLDGDKLSIIHEDSIHLIGQDLKLRSVFYCNHPDREGCCSACFGDLALSIPQGTNVGHVCATALCEQSSQIIMSTKHLDGSSTVDDIELSEYEKQFLHSKEGDNRLYLSPSLEKDNIKLVVPDKDAQGLTDIVYADNIERLGLHNLTSLVDVLFYVNDSEEPSSVSVSMGNRRSSFSFELLSYIKVHGWTLDGDNNYVIDLKAWDSMLPLFEMPLRHLNMTDYIKTIQAKIIGSSMSDNAKTPAALKAYGTPDAALASVYELVSSKLMVNLAHLEVIVFSQMYTSDRPHDRQLPHRGDEGKIGTFPDNMQLRSLSALMAFQAQHGTIYSPKSYTVKYRPDHVLDPLLVVKDPSL